MKNYINKLFNLQGLIADKINFEDNEKDVFVCCRGASRFVKCPNCSKSTKRVHQMSHRKIKHSILDFKIVFLYLRIRRFKCKHCGLVFTESFKGIDRRKTSTNFRLQILDQLKRNSFNYISEKFNIAPATAVRYLLEMNGDIKIEWDKVNVTKLGIDEHSFRGHKLIITITDLSNKKLLAILKADDQKTLEAFINEIPSKHRDKIDEACTDLRASYKTVIKKCLPNAIYTADRYHVEVLARRTVDNIRTILETKKLGRRINTRKLLWANKDTLDFHQLIKLDLVWKKYKNYPTLKQAWIIKEKIIDMYRSNNRKEAEIKMKHIIMLLETHDLDCCYLNTLKNTLKSWKNEILNYFENRTTNGFTEGCHTKIKMIKRVSFGFKNINNYIAKITLAFLPLSWIISYHTV